MDVFSPHRFLISPAGTQRHPRNGLARVADPAALVYAVVEPCSCWAMMRHRRFWRKSTDVLNYLGQLHAVVQPSNSGVFDRAAARVNGSVWIAAIEARCTLRCWFATCRCAHPRRYRRCGGALAGALPSRWHGIHSECCPTRVGRSSHRNACWLQRARIRLACGRCSRWYRHAA